MENRPEKKRIAPFRILTILLSCGVFLFAGIRLLGYFREEQESALAQSSMAQHAHTPVETAPTAETAPQTEPGPEETEEASPTEEETLPAISYEIPLRVDFDTLRQEGPDIVAWLYCADTLINDPVVQGPDNDYYLNRLPNGKSNANGSLFMDYRNLPDFGDRNTLIYGHNMQSGKMFGTLNRYKNQSYYDEHPVLWLLTPELAYRVDLIAGIVTASDSEDYAMLNSDDALRTHLEELVDASTFVSNTSIEGVDRIVTLSTCSYEFATARYILVGALTPAEYPPEA